MAPPSANVLAALADALRLDHEERRYMWEVAQPDRRAAPPAEPPAADRAARLIEDLATLPALVTTPFLDVLVWNAAAAELFLDFGALHPAERNLLRLFHFDSRLTGRFVNRAELRRASAGVLRAAAAQDPMAPELRTLVDALVRCDPEFGRFWASQEVGRRPRSCSTYLHPTAGPLILDWQVFVSAEDPNCLVVVVTPRPAPLSPR